MKDYLTRTAKVLLIALFTITIFCQLITVIDFQETSSLIPSASKGQVILFDREMGKSSVISDIEITENYIFFAYSAHGVVTAYNWDGIYQFSLSFFNDTNGTLEMRCDGGLLYVCDYETYEYIFEGDELLEINKPSEREHRIGWFSEDRNLPLQIRCSEIYDELGKYIMQIPGKLNLN